MRGKPAFGHFASAKGALRNLAQALAKEYGPAGVHVAHVIIDGVVEGDRARSLFGDYLDKFGPEGALDPAAVAEAFWSVHAQPRSAWTHELDLRPFSEKLVGGDGLHDVFLWVALGFSVIGLLAHELVGSPQVLAPLAQAEMQGTVKSLLAFLWHVGSVAVLAMIAMFACAATLDNQMPMARDRRGDGRRFRRARAGDGLCAITRISGRRPRPISGPWSPCRALPACWPAGTVMTPPGRRLDLWRRMAVRAAVVRHARRQDALYR